MTGIFLLSRGRSRLFVRMGLAAFVSMALTSCGSDPSNGRKRKSEGTELENGVAKSSTMQPMSDEEMAEIHGQVVTFCGNCHETPKPDRFPRAAWSEEVDRGFNFYYQSGRSDLEVPAKRPIVDYFRQLAPESLTLPVPAPPDRKLRFVKSTIKVLPPDKRESLGQGKWLQGVSHLLWTNELGPSPRLLISDMSLGGLAEWVPSDKSMQISAWTEVGHPAHAEILDLDGNGELDLVIADLGSFSAEDHQKGRVLWLKRSEANNEAWDVHVLASDLGRVADVEPGDFDGDGDLDLAVAEFGWLKTGRLLLLMNQGSSSKPEFSAPVVINPRHGASHLASMDLNHDGKLDLVALISQEFETIDAFINQGDGEFKIKTLFAADDPAFGSSGAQLVDLDQDGDLDLLYTNGDMLDGYYAKPYHAVWWIENRGEETWLPHKLATLPGAMAAAVGDLDNDGDLDIVAAALVPQKAQYKLKATQTLASLIWIEQTAPGEFVPRTLETDACHHAAVEIGDFDGDGDQDIAVGNFRNESNTSLTIWTNQLIANPDDDR